MAGTLRPPPSLVQPRRERDPDHDVLARLEPCDRLAPWLLARVVEQLVTAPAPLLGRGLDGFGVLDLELDAYLRHRPLGGPFGRAEARLRRLRERPDAEVLAAADALAVDVVVAARQRQAERVDEELAALRGVGGDDGDACDELH